MPKTAALMKADLFIVTLEKFTYGGEALGRLPDGRAVFVPFALPGETVRLRCVEEKHSLVHAEVVEVIEATPERIPPRCRHYGTCGGCHYQHLSYRSQLTAKTDILREQLQRIGKIDEPPLQPIVPSPQEWNYRNHIQFHLTEAGELGFVSQRGKNILPITECHLPDKRLNDLWPNLHFNAGLRLERVALRLGVDEEIMLILESEEPPAIETEADLSVVHLSGEDVLVMAGNGALRMDVLGHTFQVSAASFFQVNTGVAGKMVEHLLEKLPLSSQDTLLDVYCGVGLFSSFFAARLHRLIGIESSPAACQDFSINLDEYDNVELYQAPAEEVLPALDVKPQGVIVDPPRGGLAKGALEALLALKPERIAYVSCDPSTLGRDAARLIAGGYHLTEVTPFDMFPQTYHIESISIFEKG